MSDGYIHIVEHTADWSIRVLGTDLAHLLHNAAIGMAMLMVEDRSSLPCDVTREVDLEAYDAESLLVEWLSELAYWAEAEQLVLCRVDSLETNGHRLTARVVCGEASVLEKHIKAVTYHDLAIKESDSGLETTIVFDV